MDPGTPTVGESSNTSHSENYPRIPVVTGVVLDNTSVITNMDLQLFNVVTSGDVVGLKNILGYPEDTSILHKVTPVKDTLIHVAASRGHDEIIKTILGYKSELLMEVNLLGETALHRAARAGHFATVKLLIDIAKGGNVESRTMSALMSAKNHQMETALHVAVSNSHVKISTMLMEEDHTSELLCLLSNTGESPLHVAVQKGNMYIVEEILKRSQLSNEGPNGRTALHAAVINELAEITSLLLKKELVQKKDVNGRTPLHFAAGLGFSEIVTMLLGYDLSTTCFLDNTGYAAIHNAAIFGNLDIIKQFIGFQPYLGDLLDRSGQNLLQIAINSEQAGVVKYILSNKLFEDLLYGRDTEGNTILHQAVIIGNPFVLNILVKDKRIRAMSTALNKKGCSARSIATSKCEESFERRREMLVLATLTRWLPEKQRTGNTYDYIRRGEVANEHDERWDSKKESNTLMVVSTLVVGATFAAGLTLSGGETITHEKAKKFKAFIKWDLSSMIAALSSVTLLIPTNRTVFLPRILTLVSLFFLVFAFSAGLDFIWPRPAKIITHNFQGLIVSNFRQTYFADWLLALFCMLLIIPQLLRSRGMGIMRRLRPSNYATLVLIESWRHHEKTRPRFSVSQRIELMTRKIEQVPTAP